MTPKQQASQDIKKDDSFHHIYINQEKQTLTNLLLETE